MSSSLWIYDHKQSQQDSFSTFIQLSGADLSLSLISTASQNRFYSHVSVIHNNLKIKYN